MWRWLAGCAMVLAGAGGAGAWLEAPPVSVTARLAPTLAFAARITARPACDATVVASTARANALIARAVRGPDRPFVLCLSGAFVGPIVVRDKRQGALLVIEGARHDPAVIAPRAAGALPAVGVDGLNAAVVVERSSGVELRDLTVRGPVGEGARVTPAGILVEADGSRGCGPEGCREIALVNDTVEGIANEADRSPAVCGSGSVNAFGITVFDPSRHRSGALREVVIAGSEVRDARTGASELVSINGDVAGFLVEGNTVVDGDNIGIDLEGGYGGSLPARDGLVTGNEVANIDSLSNTTAGTRAGRACVGQESAAGIYDDGARDVAITHNRVFDTNQGISLDAEVPHATSSAILVADNLVVDLPGTSAGPRSLGRAPGVPASTVAGHAFDALYVDTYGPGSMVEGVLALDNRLVNRSRYFSPGAGYRAVTVGIGGRSAQVALCGDRLRAAPGGRVVPLAIGPRTSGVLVAQLAPIGRPRWVSGSSRAVRGLARAACQLLEQRLGHTG